MKQINPVYDVIVIGSGPAGVHAAFPLIKSGLKVAIVDGGLEGNKKDIYEKTNQLLKIKSNIPINQCLTKGGFSQVWPGICDFFTNQEIEMMGLKALEIINGYSHISKLIKLNLRPQIDTHCKLILKNFHNSYQLPQVFDYKTSKIINQLKRYENFTYIPNQLVSDVCSKKTIVEVNCVTIDKQMKNQFIASYLMLASGSINTTRILLKSFNLYDYKTPFLTKSNYMVICFHIRSLFKKILHSSNIYGQVAISDSLFFTQFYRFNPNTISKALSLIPLPKKVSSFILKLFGPYLVIADTRFASLESNKNYYKLTKRKRGGDILEIFFCQRLKDIKNQEKKLNEIRTKLLSAGLIPIKIIKGDVTSHYAGGIPINQRGVKLSTNSNGRLNQSKRIFVADSSTWRALPAKPPTLSIMVNAERVGQNLLNIIKNDR